MMELHSLALKLTERLKAPLPGVLAHDLLRATPIGDMIPNFSHKSPPRPGSVIILLYEQDGQIKFPMIKRPQYLGAHSNQVSFPGGKADKDELPVETAIRETEEEIGVERSAIDVLGTLSTFFVIPSNFIVTPVVAITKSPEFKPDSREVAKILQGDLTQLIHPDAIQTKEILAAGTFRMMAPHFEFENEIVEEQVASEFAVRESTYVELPIQKEDKVMKDESVPSGTCKNKVEEAYKIGQRLGINGTPSMVFSDGTLSIGYRPAQELADLAIKHYQTPLK